MRLKLMQLPIFILFLLLLSISASAQTVTNDKGYVTSPYDTQKPVHYWNGELKFVNYWELPLWVQISLLSIFVVAILSLTSLIPFVFGRLKSALENQKTKNLLAYIQRNPGRSIAEISNEQNINRGTLKYHLNQLLANNKIIFIRKGKFSQIFHNTSTAMDMESRISGYLRNDKTRSFLFTIMDNPGITNQEISQKFTLGKSTVHDNLKKFVDDGIIEFRQDGKFKRCYIKQDAKMILLRFKPQ